MTRLLVLGMLDKQPMSGYDIQQALHMTDAQRWSGVLIGSIYHALKKLEHERCVEIASLEHTGHRQKAVYKITEKGKNHLKDLVYDALQVSSVSYPSTLYAGLSFADQLSRNDARQALEQQRSALNNECLAVEQGLEAKSAAMENDIPLIVQLMFDNMFAIIRQQQKFVEQALAIIDGQE